jgi:hypothetical protein
MTNIKKFLERQRSLARIFLIAGLITAAGGAVLERTNVFLGVDPRLVTGLGILLLGLSLACWLKYFNGRKDPQAARRTISAESDERMIVIKNKAGQNGFWVGLAMTYGLLMWESISSNGALPALSDDARWFWLAAAVVLPMLIYIASIVQGNKM